MILKLEPEELHFDTHLILYEAVFPLSKTPRALFAEGMIYDGNFVISELMNGAIALLT